MSRQPKGFSSTNYSKTTGKWHTWVTLGRKPNGKLDRRNVRGNTAEESAKRAKDLRERVTRGAGVPAKIETVAQWMHHWIHEVAIHEVKWKTWATYELMNRVHITPAIGAWKLDGLEGRLEPEYVRRMLNDLKETKKLAGSYRRQIHGMLKRALAQACVEGKAPRNVAEMVKPPSAAGGKKIKAHSLQEVQAIVEAALDDVLCERWLIGMILGPRQGEALAVRWHRVHLDDVTPYFEIAKQAQRRTWEHGCDDPAECVRTRTRRGKPLVLCRRTACPPRYRHGCAEPTQCRKHAHFCPDRKVVPGECSTHRTVGKREGKKCPVPCREGCAVHASTCPKRINGGIIEEDVKTEAGVREVPLFPLVAELLRLRREDQQRRGVWEDDGLVFQSPFGGHIDPRRDHDAWEQLLRKAGVADSRLHAARHTSGSLMVSKLAIEVVQEVLGHTDIRTTRQYIDIAREMKANAINELAAALFEGDLAKLLQPRMQHR